MFSRSFVQSKKVAFYYLPIQRQYIFKISNFVRLQQNRILRINQIIVYTFDRRRRLFFIGLQLNSTDTGSNVSDTEDLILSRGYRRLYLIATQPTTLFGLPAISAKHLYVVPIQAARDSVSLVRGIDVSGTLDFLQS